MSHLHVKFADKGGSASYKSPQLHAQSSSQSSSSSESGSSESDSSKSSSYGLHQRKTIDAIENFDTDKMTLALSSFLVSLPERKPKKPKRSDFEYASDYKEKRKKYEEKKTDYLHHLTVAWKIQEKLNLFDQEELSSLLNSGFTLTYSSEGNRTCKFISIKDDLKFFIFANDAAKTAREKEKKEYDNSLEKVNHWNKTGLGTALSKTVSYYQSRKINAEKNFTITTILRNAVRIPKLNSLNESESTDSESSSSESESTDSDSSYNKPFGSINGLN